MLGTATFPIFIKFFKNTLENHQVFTVGRWNSLAFYSLLDRNEIVVNLT